VQAPSPVRSSPPVAPVTAVEIDPHWISVLRQRFPQVHAVQNDMLSFEFPATPHVVVGNLPYGVTTAMSRRILHGQQWPTAVLLVQWDVARKRATGGTLLNAAWSPWYRFELLGRVPARAFRPVPSVDGGILRIHRRHRPGVPWTELAAYQRFVEDFFTGRGRGIAEIVRTVTRNRRTPHVGPGALPRDLSPHDWIRLYADFGGLRG
jgi:23S rRNA (adenine-N6)-dimethyltransferase